VMVKSDKSTSIVKVKSILKEVILEFQTEKEFRSVTLQIDVDPY